MNLFNMLSKKWKRKLYKFKKMKKKCISFKKNVILFILNSSSHITIFVSDESLLQVLRISSDQFLMITFRMIDLQIPYLNKENSIMHLFCRSRLTMSSSFLTSLYQLVLRNRCWAPCTFNAIWYFWKKASNSNPFKKGGRCSIIGSSLRISLAIWMHLVWNLHFFCIPILISIIIASILLRISGYFKLKCFINFL
jgi:hypothetical protein